MTAMSVDPAIRQSIARQGAYATNSRNDPRELAQKAWGTKKRRWAEEIDPTGELALRNPAELLRRIDQRVNQQMEKVRLAKLTKQRGRQSAPQRAQPAILPTSRHGASRAADAQADAQKETLPALTERAIQPQRGENSKTPSGGDVTITRRHSGATHEAAGTTTARQSTQPATRRAPRQNKKAALRNGSSIPQGA